MTNTWGSLAMTSSEKKWTRLKEEIKSLPSYEDATALDVCEDEFDPEDVTEEILFFVDALIDEVYDHGETVTEGFKKKAKQIRSNIAKAAGVLSDISIQHGCLSGKIEGYEHCEESINLIIKDMDRLF